jgi:uncharacterized protein YeaO (DUF488 family)
MSFQVKRVYDPPARGDGVRVLVDRMWPRGSSRERAAIDHWMRDLAPTTALRRWFAHDPERWPEFRRRYFSELAAQRERVAALRELGRRRVVTLLFAAKDAERNNAVALLDYVSNVPAGIKPRRGDRTAQAASSRSAAMIRKLSDGRYRLYSRKIDPRTGKRRNLGTFDTREAAAKHERAVQYFKRRR